MPVLEFENPRAGKFYNSFMNSCLGALASHSQVHAGSLFWWGSLKTTPPSREKSIAAATREVNNTIYAIITALL